DAVASRRRHVDVGRGGRAEEQHVSADGDDEDDDDRHDGDGGCVAASAARFVDVDFRGWVAVGHVDFLSMKASNQVYYIRYIEMKKLIFDDWLCCRQTKRRHPIGCPRCLRSR